MNYKQGFPYRSEYVDALAGALSADRFAKYCGHTGGDQAAALRLYVWNCAAASAFYGPLQTLEITLRNGVHHALVPAYGEMWFNNDHLLRGEELRMADDARSTLERIGKEVTPGRIVAELGFGYWAGLFAKAYDELLWRQHFYRLFNPRPARADLFDQLNRLRTLRNRVAHHEPIHQRVLLDDWVRIRDVLGRMSPEVRDWMEHHSRVLDVLGDGPDGTERF